MPHTSSGYRFDPAELVVAEPLDDPDGGALGVSVGVGVGVALVGVVVCVGVTVLVTGVPVTVVVGVFVTTTGVMVTVGVCGVGWLSPSTDVPEPCLSCRTSVSGRPATSSTPVTTTSTPANTPTQAAAMTVQAGRRNRPGAVSTAAGAVRGANRPAPGTTVRTRALVRWMEWLYTALPTTVSTLATAAPMTVPATPR